MISRTTHSSPAARREPGLGPVTGALGSAAAFLFLAASASAEDKSGSASAPKVTNSVTPETKQARGEARRRFDQGLARYDSGDFIGALVEFERAHELTRHPLVSYNLALVYARLGRPVQAIDALEQLEALGTSELEPLQRLRARRVYEEQLSRVGTLEVRTNVPNAFLQVNGVDVEPSPRGLRVAAGTQLVSVWAQGFEPRRVSVSVARGSHHVLEVELKHAAERLSHLTLTTNVPDVLVRANGQIVGWTPMDSDLVFPAGSSTLELTRDGYAPVRRTIALKPGSAQLAVRMLPTPAGNRAGGALVLALSEKNVSVSVDGARRLDYAGGIQLPLGRHVLRVERLGFFEVEREVMIRPGSNPTAIMLIPTPEYLEAYVDRAGLQRTWSLIAMGTGALLSVGSGTFLLWNQGEKNQAQEAFKAFTARVQGSPSGACESDSCEKSLAILVSDLEEKRDRDIFGWIGAGLGASALGAGVMLYFLGDDPGKYDRTPPTDALGPLRFELGAGRLSMTCLF